MKVILKQPVTVFFYDGTNASELAKFLGGDVMDINSYNGKRYHKVWILLPNNKKVYIHMDVDETKVAIVLTKAGAYPMDMETFNLQYEVINK